MTESSSSDHDIMQNANEPTTSVESKCPKCTIVVGDESSIMCFLCSCWYHVSCTSVSDKLFKLINEDSDNFEFICELCRPNRDKVMSSLKNMVFKNFLHDSSDKLMKVVDEVSKNIKKVETSIKSDTFASIVKNEIKEVKNLVKPKSLTHAEVAKQIKKQIIPSGSQDSKSEFILFARGIDNNLFVSPSHFKSKLSEVFKSKKITKCYIKQNGIIDIHFNNSEDMIFVKDNWKDFIYAKDSTVKSLCDYNSKEKIFTCVAKDVPTDFSESSILNDVKQDFHSVTSVSRFKKNGSQLMPIVKIALSNEEDFNRILKDGFVCNFMFFPVEILNNVKRPLRCYNCWRLGHMSNVCKNSKLCKNCGETGHLSADCNNLRKCVNCREDHSSDSISCPAYQKSLRNLNNLN